MKQLRQAIEERVAETAEADLPLLFSRKLPQKGFSEEWLMRNLEKYGAKLLTSEGWLREIPEVDSGEFPQLTTLGDLAAHLRLSVAELEWFADLKGRNPDEGSLAHYRYRWIPKRRGGRRLLMEPKESLKMMQRRILETVLDLIPLHETAHGFRKGRSIRTFSEPHCGKKVVARMDLADFFPSVTQARVVGIFEMIGCREVVARHLAGLCTHGAPKVVTSALRLRQRHLPQGAPTSPALANAIAFRLDRRLSGLAKSAGLNYTRYADDLAFSGERVTESFRDLVNVIILEEGFLINPRKSRVMTSSTRQRIAGVVVNEHPNVSRSEFDVLKAILYNGPDLAEKDVLRGKIAAVQMLNPQRGAKLLLMFAEARWK